MHDISQRLLSTRFLPFPCPIAFPPYRHLSSLSSLPKLTQGRSLTCQRQFGVQNTCPRVRPVSSIFYYTVLATRIILLLHYCTATGLRFTCASFHIALRIQVASHFDLAGKLLENADEVCLHGDARILHVHPLALSQVLVTGFEMEKTFRRPLLHIRPPSPSIEDVSLGSVLFRRYQEQSWLTRTRTCGWVKLLNPNPPRSA